MEILLRGMFVYWLASFFTELVIVYYAYTSGQAKRTNNGEFSHKLLVLRLLTSYRPCVLASGYWVILDKDKNRYVLAGA